MRTCTIIIIISLLFSTVKGAWTESFDDGFGRFNKTNGLLPNTPFIANGEVVAPMISSPDLGHAPYTKYTDLSDSLVSKDIIGFSYNYRFDFPLPPEDLSFPGSSHIGFIGNFDSYGHAINHLRIRTNYISVRGIDGSWNGSATLSLESDSLEYNLPTLIAIDRNVNYFIDMEYNKSTGIASLNVTNMDTLNTETSFLPGVYYNQPEDLNYLGFGSYDAYGDVTDKFVYYDNITAYSYIPEPCTLLLLAAGTIAVRMKHRRQ